MLLSTWTIVRPKPYVMIIVLFNELFSKVGGWGRSVYICTDNVIYLVRTADTHN